MMPEFATITFATGESTELTLNIVSAALLASLFTATLLAEVCADKLPGNTFVHRLAYACYRYALPACGLSAFLYWAVLRFGR
jgi:hypothetical protein